MRRRWPTLFKASDVADLINDRDSVTFGDDTYAERKADAATLRDFLFGPTSAGFVATARSVGKLIGRFIDKPVKADEKILVLRRKKQKDVSSFRVSEPGCEPPNLPT